MKFLKAMGAFVIYYFLILFIFAFIVPESALKNLIVAILVVFSPIVLSFFIAVKAYKLNTMSLFKIFNINTTKKDKIKNEVLRIKYFHFPYDRKKYQILFERLEIAGINYKFENAKKIFQDDEKTYIVFEREQENEYDKNAIAIYAVHENNKEHVGYVDKEKAKFIVENNLLDCVVPKMDYIAIGDRKIFQATYQILITKEKMKELRKESVIKDKNSV